jgi:hypothetical protein
MDMLIVWVIGVVSGALLSALIAWFFTTTEV